MDRASRNKNHAAEVAYASLIQKAVFNAVKSHDPKTRDRGVKDQSLKVLDDTHLGSKTRGCLVEIEFIDRKDTDELLNLGPDAPQVRNDIARAIADALIAAL